MPIDEVVHQKIIMSPYMVNYLHAYCLHLNWHRIFLYGIDLTELANFKQEIKRDYYSVGVM